MAPPAIFHELIPDLVSPFSGAMMMGSKELMDLLAELPATLRVFIQYQRFASEGSGFQRSAKSRWPCSDYH